MMEKDVYEKLEKSCPTGYRINELVPFYYPVRHITLKVLVNKQPDASLVKIYSVILKAMEMGFDDKEKLFAFLGLSKGDEFMERELYALREKNYADIISEKWFVTQAGKEFINDNKIMRIEAEEDFDFFLDGISGNLILSDDFEKADVVREKEDKLREDRKKFLYPKIKYFIRSPDLVDGKFSQIADIFKLDNPEEALITYDPNNIKKDFEEWCPYWLVEYIPDGIGAYAQEAALEIRTFNTLKTIKSMTNLFNAEYQHYMYELTASSDRIAFKELSEDEPSIAKEFETSQSTSVSSEKRDFEELSIWKTKVQFIESLKTVNEKILIESPWIKRATLEYISYFEKLLQHKKRLIILYGIEGMDEHDDLTFKKLDNLQKQYNTLFTLIHLPTHLKGKSSKYTGSHRKLVIKDDDYYISGSFNFLSFAKQDWQKIANEESHMIRKNVKDKWEQVLKEYAIKM